MSATPDRAAAPAPLAERLAELSAKLGGELSFSPAIPERKFRAQIWLNRQYLLTLPATEEGSMWAEFLTTCANAYRDGTLLAALDGREAWNEAIEAAAKALDEYKPTRPIMIETAQDKIRALARVPEGNGDPDAR